MVTPPSLDEPLQLSSPALRPDLDNRTYRWVVRILAFLMRRLDVRRTVHGIEHVPGNGGAVLAISHFSYVDFIMSEWAIFDHLGRYTRFLATKKSFETPLVGRVMTAMGHVPVDRHAGASAYQHAVQALARGEIVGVFPETRVSHSFTLLPFKTGAARMAAESAAPIIPCVIFGSQRLRTRTQRVPLRRARHIPVTICFGEPIQVAHDADPQTVTEALRHAMSGLLEDVMDDYPLQPGSWWVPAHRGGSAPTPEADIGSIHRDTTTRDSA